MTFPRPSPDANRFPSLSKSEAVAPQPVVRSRSALVRGPEGLGVLTSADGFTLTLSHFQESDSKNDIYLWFGVWNFALASPVTANICKLLRALKKLTAATGCTPSPQLGRAPCPATGQVLGPGGGQVRTSGFLVNP